MNIRVSTLVLTLGLASFSSAACAQGAQTTLLLWPHNTPEPAQTTEPEADTTKPTDGLISGHRTVRLTNVTMPSLSVYPPRGHNTGAAALVFPGGGYRMLAMNGEGTDPCDWLNSLGMTCILVKYRVPEQGHYPDNPADLEDAQQAMRLTRAHATQWHIDPIRIGVMGFSAGANLAVLLCTHPTDDHVNSTPAAPDVPGVHGRLNGQAMLTDPMDARADFAILAYPAYLAVPPDQVSLDPVYTPNEFTPNTFLIQAENDTHYGKNAIVYYRALMDAKVPSELHYFATGGHGFGIHPIGAPEEHWSELAAAWLRSINVLPALDSRNTPTSAGGAFAPCPNPQPPTPGRSGNPSTNNPSPSSPNYNNAANSPNPNCWQSPQ